MTTALENFLAGYRTAWQERDADAVVRLFTTEAEYRDNPYQPAHHGASGIRDYWTKVTSTQADITVRYGSAITTGNRAAVEWWTNLTNDGAALTLAGSFVLRFSENGLCEELTEYWHITEGTQIPPAGWGE